MTTTDPDHCHDPTAATAADDVVSAIGRAMLEAANASANQHCDDPALRAWQVMYAGATVFTALLRGVPPDQRSDVVRGVNGMFANMSFPWRLRREH